MTDYDGAREIIDRLDRLHDEIRQIADRVVDTMRKQTKPELEPTDLEKAEKVLQGWETHHCVATDTFDGNFVRELIKAVCVFHNELERIKKAERPRCFDCISSSRSADEPPCNGCYRTCLRLNFKAREE